MTATKADDFWEPCNKLEKDLKIPPCFYKTLLKEDDWSFIIKLHALIEASVACLLVKSIKEPKLENILVALPMSNKIRYLKELSLLNDYRGFIQALSEIRNGFVHEIKNVNVPLDEFLKQNNCAKSKLSSALKEFCENSEIESESKTFMSSAKINPKTVIWILGAGMLTEVYLQANPMKTMSRLERALSELKVP